MTQEELIANIQVDPYKAGAAFMLNKNMQDVTNEDRDHFKVALFAVYQTLAPQLVSNDLVFFRMMIGELESRGLWDSVAQAVEKKLK